MAHYVQGDPALQSGSATDVAIGYAGGDRRIEITATQTGSSTFGLFNGLPIANMLSETSHWAPSATVNPLDNTYQITFSFASTIRLEEYHFELSGGNAWGTWTVEVFRGAQWEALAATDVLGGAKYVEHAIDSDKQTGVSGFRLTGDSGIVSGAPYVENIRFFGTLE